MSNDTQITSIETFVLMITSDTDNELLGSFTFRCSTGDDLENEILEFLTCEFFPVNSLIVVNANIEAELLNIEMGLNPNDSITISERDEHNEIENVRKFEISFCADNGNLHLNVFAHKVL